MPISDLCSRPLVSVERKASLQFAAQMMKKHHVGGLVVLEAGAKGKPLGIITDRDIVLSVVAENQPLNTPVQDVMTREVVMVPKTQGIAEVVDRMANKGVRRIVVVDESGQACGLVSVDDILQLVAREINGLGRLVDRQLQNEGTLKRAAGQFMV